MICHGALYLAARMGKVTLGHIEERLGPRIGSMLSG